MKNIKTFFDSVCFLYFWQCGRIYKEKGYGYYLGHAPYVVARAIGFGRALTGGAWCAWNYEGN